MLSFALHLEASAGGEQKQQHSVPALRRPSEGAEYSALQSTLKHALPWHNNATQKARCTSKCCSRDSHKSSTPSTRHKSMSRAALAMQSTGWGGSAPAVPSDLDATSGLVAAALAAAWAVLITKVFTLDAYTGVQMLSLWLVSVACFLRGVGRLQERRRGGSSGTASPSSEAKTSSETKKTK